MVSSRRDMKSVQSRRQRYLIIENSVSVGCQHYFPSITTPLLQDNTQQLSSQAENVMFYL